MKMMCELVVYGCVQPQHRTDDSSVIRLFNEVLSALRRLLAKPGVKKISYSILTMVLLVLTVNSVSAQNTDSKWNFLIEPYLMFPGMKGETAIRQLQPVEVDADANDVLGKLKFGAMLYAEATNKDWTISSDFIYMDLEQGVKTTRVITSGDLSVTQLALEFAGLKRLAPWMEAGIAGRIVSLQAGLNLETINGSSSESSSKIWLDPVIVLRLHGTVHDKWLLQFRGDFGGFGIGSDFTWQIQANIGYRFSKLFQTSIGYRIIAIDYEKGDGTDLFLYNINTFGPVVRLGFNL